jgi:hypothetical protein
MRGDDLAEPKDVVREAHVEQQRVALGDAQRQ